MSIVSKNLDVLIVEDSLSYALELERLCTKIGFNIVGIVDSSADALDSIYADNPDFILMDIEINGKMSGLEVGEKINHTDIPIIYITSFSDQKKLADARKSNLAGFLIKPISETSLLSSLQNIVKEEFHIHKDGDAKIFNSANNTQSLFFQKKGTYVKTDLANIVYVQSEDNYCRFYSSNGEVYLMRITMAEVERITSKINFYRCHRKYIVNLNKNEGINMKANQFLMTGGYTIPFSRSKKDTIKKYIKTDLST